MKELEKMNDDRRVRLAIQRAQELLMRQAAESCQVGGKSLSGLYRRAEPTLSVTRQRRWRLWLPAAAVVLLVAVPLGLMASVGIGSVLPAPDGYVMNLYADRIDAIAAVNSLIYNL
jgi:hypothetical protein